MPLGVHLYDPAMDVEMAGPPTRDAMDVEMAGTRKREREAAPPTLVLSNFFFRVFRPKTTTFLADMYCQTYPAPDSQFWTKMSLPELTMFLKKPSALRTIGRIGMRLFLLAKVGNGWVHPKMFQVLICPYHASF